MELVPSEKAQVQESAGDVPQEQRVSEVGSEEEILIPSWFSSQPSVSRPS